MEGVAITMSTVFITARHSLEDFPLRTRVLPLHRLPKISYKTELVTFNDHSFMKTTYPGRHIERYIHELRNTGTVTHAQIPRGKAYDFE